MVLPKYMDGHEHEHEHGRAWDKMPRDKEGRDRERTFKYGDDDNEHLVRALPLALCPLSFALTIANANAHPSQSHV